LQNKRIIVKHDADGHVWFREMVYYFNILLSKVEKKSNLIDKAPFGLEEVFMFPQFF